MRITTTNLPSDGHQCEPGAWGDAHGCCYRVCARCGRVLSVVSNRALGRHLAGLAAAGLKAKPLATGESYAKGLPRVNIEPMPREG
ncbi:MAG: hypothetical protein ACOZHQ_09305 [Thermodesulfobacteriota bacterium]